VCVLYVCAVCVRARACFVVLQHTESGHVWAQPMAFISFPSYNPKRQHMWSHPYHDHGESGLILTLNTPIDVEDYFFAFFAVDIIGKAWSMPDSARCALHSTS